MEEIWKDIPGYEGYYQASNIGRIKSLRRKVPHRGRTITIYEKYLRQAKSGNGYFVVTLCDTKNQIKRHVHALVAEAFLSKKDTDECVNHLDLNKLNNCVENLEWTTLGDNNRHARLNGPKVNYRNRKGENVYNSKATDILVIKARELYKEGLSTPKIGLIIGLSRSVVYNIVSRRSWKHIP